VPESNVVETTTGAIQPDPSLITYTHVIYALHTTSIVIGTLGTATVIGAFVFGIPSIIAVIMNYIRQSETRGTYLASHFRWQIRTFWYALLWLILSALFFVVIGWILVLTIVGIPIAFAPFIALTCWIIYRIARGWLRLKDKQPMYT
jgi:uncharacterized membrane protein